MSELPAETLDRLLSGKLPAAEQRRLAQAALDDPELFDLLTAAGAVSSILDRNQAEVPLAETRRPDNAHRSRTIAIVAAAMAATIVLTVGYRWRSGDSSPASTSIGSSQSRAATTSRSVPVIAPPILLTAHLGAEAGRSPASFRADDNSRRVPRPSGTVISADAGVIEIDLGSLDGVGQGSALTVFRDGRDAAQIGRITITTVFRERSRGRSAEAGAVRAGDRIQVAPGVHVTALLGQVTARRSIGDLPGARAVADMAVTRAQMPAVSADLRRLALQELGMLEHQLGARDESDRHLRAAIDAFNEEPMAQPAERAEILNELGTVQIEHGDYDAAERTLQAAQPLSADVTKLRVTSNLGALAALRGDRTSAGALYRQARSLASDRANLAAERAAIDKNLDGLAHAR